jgi:16S rRNA (guanine(966)-N(2))-methyltransferase RsmD
MRVTAGEFRSRRLKSLPGNAMRPTPELLRQVLFNVLGGRIEGAVFVDAYAGTGAVGIEALSRGAAHAILIEKHRAAISLIRENLHSLSIEDRATVVPSAAASVIARYGRGIVFLDPPYELTREYAACLRILGEHRPDIVIAQHDKRLKLEPTYGSLTLIRTITHGDNALSLLE